MNDYAGNCCASHLSLNTQRMLCEVLWRISQGLEANDDTSECATMPEEFEKRLVTQKGKKRMGILDYWQHGPGVDARIAACTIRNPCGIKRNVIQRSAGAEARCEKCDPN